MKYEAKCHSRTTRNAGLFRRSRNDPQAGAGTSAGKKCAIAQKQTMSWEIGVMVCFSSWQGVPRQPIGHEPAGGLS